MKESVPYITAVEELSLMQTNVFLPMVITQSFCITAVDKLSLMHTCFSQW